jgi:hypothetical protein
VLGFLAQNEPKLAAINYNNYFLKYFFIEKTFTLLHCVISALLAEIDSK